MPTFPIALIPTIYDDMAAMDKRDATKEEMAFIHNSLIRSLNSIYFNADKFAVPDELPPFLMYIEGFVEITKYHHLGEEKYFFPRLLRDIPEMQHNVDQHLVIHELLHKLEEFYTEAKQDPKSYSAVALRAILDIYGHPFAQHLNDELKTLDPALLRKAISSEELGELILEEVMWIVQNSNGAISIPVVLGGHDPKSNSCKWPTGLPEEFWNSIPGIVSVHQAAWKYCPFNPVTGEPQTVSA